MNEDRHPKDLETSVHENVIKNQGRPIGQHVILSMDGLHYEYFHDNDLFIVERLSKRIKSEIGWFEKLSRHGPSIGSFYEALIESALKEVIPSNLKVGNGFVYDSLTKTASPQVDFIIYRDFKNPVIYKRGDFVVVDSPNVFSCIEIKKTLTSQILRDIVNNYCNINLGTSRKGYKSIQYLNVFVFQSKMTSRRILETLSKHISDFLSTFSHRTISGAEVKMSLFHLVLPRIYFFDRPEYILISCSPNTENKFNISAEIQKTATGENSLGEFLQYSCASNKSENQFSRKNFLTVPLMEIAEKYEVANDIAIVRKLSMEEIIKRFPNELHLLRAATKERSRKPYGAMISTAIKLKGIKLTDLQKLKGFSWLTTNPKST